MKTLLTIITAVLLFSSCTKEVSSISKGNIDYKYQNGIVYTQTIPLTGTILDYSNNPEVNLGGYKLYLETSKNEQVVRIAILFDNPSVYTKDLSFRFSDGNKIDLVRISPLEPFKLANPISTDKLYKELTTNLITDISIGESKYNSVSPINAIPFRESSIAFFKEKFINN